MTDSPTSHYRLPDDTDASVRGMVLALGAFFVALFMVVAPIFFHAQAIAQLRPFGAEQRFVRPYETAIA